MGTRVRRDSEGVLAVSDKLVRVRNERLRAVRDARRWTQKEMARALEKHAWEVMKEHEFTCSVRKLQHWEAGIPPQKIAVRVLISCLGKTAAELGLEPDPEPPWCGDVASVTVLAGGEVALSQEDDVQRRQFVTTIPAVLAAPALIGVQRHLSMDDVTELREAAERLRVIDNQIGGDHLHPIAGQYIQRSLPLLEGAAPASVRKAMHSAVGGMAADAGWYAFDGADHGQARIYLHEALLHARLSPDPVLEAQVMNSWAILALTADRPQEALGAARRGQQATESVGTPRTRALLAMREARAWAQLHEVGAAQAAIGRAWEHLSAAGLDDADPPWVYFVDRGELRSLNSICETDLGEYERAAQGFEQSVDVVGPYPRNRAVRTARLAHARLGMGEVEGACLAAQEAVRGVASSSRTRDLLTDFTRKLSAHDAPVAREFVERWRAFRATPTVT